MYSKSKKNKNVSISVEVKYEVEVASSDSIRSVKAKVQNNIGCPVEGNMNLFVGGSVLGDDDRTIADYSIKNKDTLHVVGKFKIEAAKSTPHAQGTPCSSGSNGES